MSTHLDERTCCLPEVPVRQLNLAVCCLPSAALTSDVMQHSTYVIGNLHRTQAVLAPDLRLTASVHRTVAGCDRSLSGPRRKYQCQPGQQSNIRGVRRGRPSQAKLAEHPCHQQHSYGWLGRSIVPHLHWQ